jgi:hypothetical protein
MLRGKLTFPWGEPTIPWGKLTFPRGGPTIPRGKSSSRRGKSATPQGKLNPPQGTSSLPQGRLTQADKIPRITRFSRQRREGTTMAAESPESTEDSDTREISSWFEQVQTMPLAFRLLHGGLCAAMGIAGLWEGLQLARQGGVFEKLVAFLVVEPFGLYFAVAGLFEIAPGIVPSKWPAAALLAIANRMWIVVALLAGGVLFMAIWWLWLVMTN